VGLVGCVLFALLFHGQRQNADVFLQLEVPDRNDNNTRAAQLLLRPHDLDLAGEGTPARVIGRGFAGAFSQVEVLLGEQVLQLYLSGPAPSVGEIVSVRADMDRARLVAL
jgi:hypothetical protein